MKISANFVFSSWFSSRRLPLCHVCKFTSSKQLLQSRLRWLGSHIHIQITHNFNIFKWFQIIDIISLLHTQVLSLLSNIGTFMHGRVNILRMVEKRRTTWQCVLWWKALKEEAEKRKLMFMNLWSQLMTFHPTWLRNCLLIPTSPHIRSSLSYMRVSETETR